MSDRSSCLAPCGRNNSCYPIFSGKRITGPNLPEDYDVNHILRCSDGKLFRKLRNPNGFTWEPISLPNNCPFVFLDVCNDVVCLVNFDPTKPKIPVSPVSPVSPVGPTDQNDLDDNIVGPELNSTGYQNTQSSNQQGKQTSLLAANGSVIETAEGAISTGNTLTVTAIPSGTPLAMSPSVVAPEGTLVVSSGVGNGANLDLVVLSNGSSILRTQGDDSESTGTIFHGRLQDSSRAIISDNASYAQFVAVSQSLVRSDQDGSHAGGYAEECSLLQAGSVSSMARGSSFYKSEIRTGGLPRLKHLPRSSRFTVAQVGIALNSPEVNQIQAITFDTDTGCADRTVYVQNSNNPIQPPLGFFTSKISLGSVGLDHAPGAGHGALATGLSVSEASLLATANGSLAIGTAECGEIHQAVGKASFSMGRSNTALGAYSQAFGHNALAYLHAHFAQAIRSSTNDDVPQGAERIQFNMVPLRSSTTCKRILSEDGKTVVGFRLTSILVLGDTPDNALIKIEDGPTLDYRRIPFLPYNGTAIVEADLVSPRLLPDKGDPLSEFCGKYCFCVTRVGADNQIRHEIKEDSNGDTLHPICVNPDPSSLNLTITVIARNGNNAGFTLQIEEDIPLTVIIDSNTVPNPRIDPPPPNIFPADNHTNFVIQGRIWGGHFKYTEVPAGSTEVKCEAPTINQVAVVGPSLAVAAPIPRCRNCCPDKLDRMDRISRRFASQTEDPFSFPVGNFGPTSEGPRYYQEMGGFVGSPGNLQNVISPQLASKFF